MTEPSIESFLEPFSPRVRALALRAREMILRECPEASEKVWPGWKLIGFGTGPKMSDVVCGIAPLKERINLIFTRGTELPDPDGLLEGTSTTGRHLKIDSLEHLESPAVDALLRASFALHRTGAEAPAASRAEQEKPPVSDEAVKTATGRDWSQWFAVLDGEGAHTLSHPQIATLLAERYGVPPWWQQMVTVGYERARGLREKHQTPDGYQVGASKTVAVPVERLFAAWTDDGLRGRWLDDAPFTVRKATPAKSLRITWGDGSHLDVLFYPKGEAKSQVSVDQRRLPDSAAVERMRAYWKERLERMKGVLEG